MIWSWQQCGQAKQTLAAGLHSSAHSSAGLSKSEPGPGLPAIPLLLQMCPLRYAAQEGCPNSYKARGLGAILCCDCGQLNQIKGRPAKWRPIQALSDPSPIP